MNIDVQTTLENLRQRTKQISDTLPQSTISFVETSRDLRAIVDAPLAPRLRELKWFAVVSRGNHVYAVTDFKGKRIAMQRLVIAMTEDRWDFDQIKNVSFANKHPMDCRYENLTAKVGRQAAMRNRKGKRNTSSQYKGVRKTLSTKGTPRWKAQIMGGFGNVHLGTYSEEETAALIYDQAARTLFNGAELLNLPDIAPTPEIVREVEVRLARARMRFKHNNEPE